MNIVKYNHNNKEIIVATYDQVAEAFKCDESNLRMNFSRNKKRFIEGEDFYKLSKSNLQFLTVTNSCNPVITPNTTVLTIFTERGVLKHMKMIGTDEAWAGYDMLLDTYFKVKNQAPKVYTLEESLELNLQLVRANNEKDIKIKQLIQSQGQITAGRDAKLMGKCSSLTKKVKKITKACYEATFMKKFESLPKEMQEEILEAASLYEPKSEIKMKSKGLFYKKKM